MTHEYCLHYAPDNASLCVRLALEELGVPYKTTLVDRATQEQRSTPFLAMNPNGLIPVLETSDGPMSETGAILFWLAEAHEQLIPPQGTDARMHAIKWLFWLSNTLHPALRMLFYPGQFTDAAHENLNQVTRHRITAHLDVLEAANDADWLDQEGPNIQACYLAPMLRWPRIYGGDTSWYLLSRWSRLYKFSKRFEARQAALICAAAEGLGPTPFSAPHPCDPPEGSAI